MDLVQLGSHVYKAMHIPKSELHCHFTHFFSIYVWPWEVLNSRKLVLKPKIKGVLTVNMLKNMIMCLNLVANAVTFKCIV